MSVCVSEFLPAAFYLNHDPDLSWFVTTWALMASLDRVHNRCMCVTFMCGEAFEKLMAVLVYHFNHHINMFIKATKVLFLLFWFGAPVVLPEFPAGVSAVFRCFSGDEALQPRVCSGPTKKRLLIKAHDIWLYLLHSGASLHSIVYCIHDYYLNSSRVHIYTPGEMNCSQHREAVRFPLLFTERNVIQALVFWMW